MNATVKRIVELLFQDVERTEEVKALEEEILNNCQDRYEDQIAQGRSEDDAIAAVVEWSGGGSNIAQIAVDVFNAYFFDQSNSLNSEAAGTLLP